MSMAAVHPGDASACPRLEDGAWAYGNQNRGDRAGEHGAENHQQYRHSDFIQSEPVSDVVKAATYRMFFLSEDNERISNENSYIADSRDQDAQKRIFRMKFQFKDKKYDKDKQYFFVVYDDATGLEVFRHPVIMDLAFADDYGF